MNSDLVFAVYCDFSKAFDNFPLRVFLSKLRNFDLDDDYILFLESYLTNRYQLLTIIGYPGLKRSTVSGKSWKVCINFLP